VLVPAGLAGAGALWVSGAGYWSWLALLAVLFSGRHNGYAGLTNSFYFRGQQHLGGSFVYGKAPASWSDLDPKCYRIPLPDFIARKGRVFRGRWTLETLEWLLIWLTFPAYNVEKQPPYNLRKIGKRKAEQQRWARQKSGLKVNVGRVLTRWALALIVFAGLIYTGWERWVA
jgi:hypothetical protein